MVTNCRTILAVIAGTTLMFSASSARGQGTHPTREFMRQKLGYTQGIVEGLVTERYGLVVTNATALRNMSLTNAFVQVRNPAYFASITNFQSKVDGLVKAASEKNLEKSTEQYSEVMGSCVSCHKMFRKEQWQASFK